MAFAEWLRRSWKQDYELEPRREDGRRDELARLASAGEAIIDCGKCAELIEAVRRIAEAED